MADPRTPAFHAKQLDDATLHVQVVLQTAMADRYYGYVVPNAGEDAINFDAEVFYDADQYFSGGFQVVELSAKLISTGPLEESVEPFAADVLAGYGQAQRSIFRYELENGDRGCSRLVGQEYLLFQPGRAEFTYPGLGGAEALPKFLGRVMRYRLTKRSLQVELQTL